MLQQTVEQLHAMRLAVMADALQSQMIQPEINALPQMSNTCCIVRCPVQEVESKHTWRVFSAHRV